MSGSVPVRRAGGIDTRSVLLSIIMVGLFASVASIWVALTIAHQISGTTAPDRNPGTMMRQLVDGKVGWSPAATIALTGIWVLVAAIVVTFAVLISRRRGAGRNRRLVEAAASMGHGQELAEMSLKHVTREAARLGVSSPGQLIGRTVYDGKPLYSGWENTQLNIWGPRRGKTTSMAIPQIIDAPGAVICTSNKRDVVDATRDVRRDSTGQEPFVFDPQAVAGEGVAGEEPDWWWNPLSYVVDDITAANLAQQFASAVDEESKTGGGNQYFEDEGMTLLAAAFLAAALDDSQIDQAFIWLTRDRDDSPAKILRGHGYTLLGARYEAFTNLTEKTRSGVFATGIKMATCLTSPRSLGWVTDPTGLRRQLVPADLVADGGTLYLLSKEGAGSAGALVAGLTVATCEAAEQLAVRTGGRLRTPLVVILDEAANVCRWRNLPRLYSHYGSRGIMINTILQNYSQGVTVWGEHGMATLLSAASVLVFGGGVRERSFLADLVALVGNRDVIYESVSYSRDGGRSTSRQLQRESILEVDDLQGLPRGKAVLFGPSAPSCLLQPVPWMVGPHAQAVRASIAAHDPAARHTLDAADAGRTAFQHGTVPDDDPALVQEGKSPWPG